MKLRQIIAGILLMLAAVPCAMAQPPLEQDLPNPPQTWPIPTPSEEVPLASWQPAPTSENTEPAMVLTDRFRESTWYTRMDYFHWNERIDGANLLNESGLLWTLGYQRRVGRERFRGEFFAGDVRYDTRIDYGFGFSEPFVSNTNYMGLKGEYDLLFESMKFPTINWYVGVGSRFWVRDLPDDFTPSGVFIQGYQETWWTVYPYVGAERRYLIPGGPEYYWSGRVGFTAMTLVHGTFDDTRLYPRPSAVGAFEMGVRGQQLFFSGYFETINWGESPEVRGWVQPASTLVLVGLKMGCNF